MVDLFVYCGSDDDSDYFVHVVDIRMHYFVICNHRSIDSDFFDSRDIFELCQVGSK